MANSDSDHEVQSTIESIMTTSSSGLIQSVVPKYKAGQNLTAHKTQNTCRICEMKVKDTHLSVKNKRFNCKFCHNAVCEKCSNIRCYHTIKASNQRICIACFNEALEDKFREECKEDVEKYTQVVVEESRTNSLELERYEKRIQECREIIKEKKAKLMEVDMKIEQLRIETEQPVTVGYVESKEMDECEKKFIGKSYKLEKLNEKVLENEKILSEIRPRNVDAQVRLADLKAELGQLRYEKQSSEKSKKELEERHLDVLKTQISTHSGVVSTLNHDIQNLKKKIAEISKDEGNCLIQ